MKSMMKWVLLATMLAAFAVANAQGGGGGGGRGGFGQGRGGGMGMDQGPAGMVNRADVQADLGLNDDQKKKLADLREKQLAAMREQFGGGRGGGGGAGGGGGFDPAEMQKRMREAAAQNEKDVNAILTPEQQKRLFEIYVQVQGNRAILNEKVQTELGLTADQKAKIKTLQDNQAAARQAVMEKMRNGEIERDQVQELNQKNNEIMNTELGKVLTSDQAAKLKSMGGKEFKASEQPRGGRGGGG